MAQEKSCAACRREIEDELLLNCSECDDYYHFPCVNLTRDNSTESDNYIKSWVCPTCYCNRPKGDNSNTPLRGSGSSSYENVTLGRGSQPRSAATKDKSAAPSTTYVSPNDLRVILREELNVALQAQLKDLREEITVFKTSMEFMNHEFERMKTEYENQNKTVIELRKDNETLRSTTQTLTKRIQHMEQYVRANNLELQCVPENKAENIVTTITQLARVIKCDISDSDIHYCSRIAKLDPTSQRPRSILVKLSSPRLRDTFLAAAIKFNKSNPEEKLNTSHLGIGGEKKTPIFVVEHLSPDNKYLHAAARKKANELRYKFVWVRGGKIFMRKTESSEYIYVRDLSHLNNLE